MNKNRVFQDLDVCHVKKDIFHKDIIVCNAKIKDAKHAIKKIWTSVFLARWATCWNKKTVYHVQFKNALNVIKMNNVKDVHRAKKLKDLHGMLLLASNAQIKNVCSAQMILSFAQSVSSILVLVIIKKVVNNAINIVGIAHMITPSVSHAKIFSV